MAGKRAQTAQAAAKRTSKKGPGAAAVEESDVEDLGSFKFESDEVAQARRERVGGGLRPVALKPPISAPHASLRCI